MPFLFHFVSRVDLNIHELQLHCWEFISLFSPPSDLLFSALIGAVSAPPFLSFKILFCCARRFFFSSVVGRD